MGYITVTSTDNFRCSSMICAAFLGKEDLEDIARHARRVNGSGNVSITILMDSHCDSEAKIMRYRLLNGCARLRLERSICFLLVTFQLLVGAVLSIGMTAMSTGCAEAQASGANPSGAAKELVLTPERSGPAIQIRADHSTVFRKLSSDQGISQARVGWIAQDHLGFLWFATQYGLNRFDGYEYKIFRKEQSRPNSLGCVYVRLVYVDRNGTLWAGCDRSIEKYDPKTETFQHFPLQTGDIKHASAVPTKVLEDGAGNLWIATHNGLFKMSASGDLQRFSHTDGDHTTVQNDDHTDMHPGDAGSFFLLEDKGVIERFDPSKGRVTERFTIAGDDSRFTLHADRWGNVWIMGLSLDCLLGKADFKHRTVHCLNLQLPKGPATGVPHIYGITDGDNRDLWVSTAGSGLIHLRPDLTSGEQAFHVPADMGSLRTDTVLFAFRDREGNYWCAQQEGGVDTFSDRPMPIHAFTTERGDIAGALVTSIYKDSHETLWIGSTGALNRIASDGTNVVPKGPGSHGEILSIIEDKKGALISGTYHDGIIGIDPRTGGFKPLPNVSDNPEILKRPIHRLLLDLQGNLWAAMEGGLGLVNRNSGKLTLFSPSSTPRFPASDVKEDHEGMLWLASESGISRFDPISKRFTTYQHNDTHEDSLSDDHVNFVFVDHADNVWAATQNGLDLFKRATQSFRVFSDKEGLAGNVAGCILEDERNHLWVGTNQGLSDFDPASGHFENYSVADGLSGPDLTGWASCYHAEDGTLYFGGFSGAISFRPKDLKPNLTPISVVFTRLVVNGSDVSAGDSSLGDSSITYANGLTLPHDRNSFSVEFAALSFRDPAAIKYRLRLVGLSDQWQTVNSLQRVATFTTLPTGRYVLEVQAAANHGQWGPSKKLLVHVPPTFWETWLFKAIVALSCLLAVLIAFRVRVEVAKRRLKERMEAGSAERERIARELHDSFFPGINGLLLHIHTAASGLPKHSASRVGIENAFRYAGGVMAQGRALVSDLRQTEEARTLESAIRAFVEDIRLVSNLKVVVVSKGRERELDPVATAEILPIAREVIRNVAKHADATEAKVELDYRNKQFVLCIEDDGRGIDPEILSRGYRDGHFGLQGMRERAAKLKAQFELTGSTLGGTRACLSVPSSIAYVSKLEQWFNR